jgi:hypothetical protein
MKAQTNKRAIAIVGVAMLAMAATAGADETDMSQIPTTGEKAAGAPFEVKASWGTFTLDPRIAAKVRNKEKMNYVFSYQASGIPLFSPQYAAGFKRGCQMGNAIYPMECASIAPVQTDPRILTPSWPTAQSIASRSSR